VQFARWAVSAFTLTTTDALARLATTARLGLRATIRSAHCVRSESRGRLDYEILMFVTPVNRATSQA